MKKNLLACLSMCGSAGVYAGRHSASSADNAGSTSENHSQLSTSPGPGMTGGAVFAQFFKQPTN